MTAADVQVGRRYWALIEDKTVLVVLAAESPFGGWVATDVKTGRRLRVRTPEQLQEAPHEGSDRT